MTASAYPKQEFRMNLSRQEQSYPHRYNQEDRSSQHPHQRVSSFHSQSQTRQSIPTEDEGSIGYQGYSNSNKVSPHNSSKSSSSLFHPGHELNVMIKHRFNQNPLVTLTYYRTESIAAPITDPPSD